MEVCVFEMETKIASLEDELSAVCSEREEILSRNEDLASELEVLTEKLNSSNSELNLLQDEVSALVRLSSCDMSFSLSIKLNYQGIVYFTISNFKLIFSLFRGQSWKILNFSNNKWRAP